MDEDPNIVVAKCATCKEDMTADRTTMLCSCKKTDINKFFG